MGFKEEKTIGANYVISHARPKFQFGIDEVIDYKNHPDIIEGLTWTRDQMVSENITQKMLTALLDSGYEQKFWFAGHTGVRGQYKHWAKEGLVQIHDPNQQSVVLIDNGVCLDLKDKSHLVNT